MERITHVGDSILTTAERVERLERDTTRMGSGGIVAGNASEFMDYDAIWDLKSPGI